MNKKIAKVLEVAALIIGIVVGVFVAKGIGVESMLRGKEEPVSLAMTEGGLQDDFVGLPAGSDIPRVSTAEEWEDTWATSLVTVEPASIIPTGIGARYSWVSAYANSGRRGGPRKRPDVNNMTFDILGEYGEYFILELPDHSYILAQISQDDAKKIKAGKEVTLPIGKKGGVHHQVLANIQELCDEYDVNTEGVFYCINDQWNESHQFRVQLTKLGILLGVTLVVGAILITIIDKVLKIKD